MMTLEEVNSAIDAKAAAWAIDQKKWFATKVPRSKDGLLADYHDPFDSSNVMMGRD
ncbi:MAG TPA: hypothetical protein VGP83_17025 [Pyrinomonadaceae bacterium]|jgi:hypothetical protein|nr:hypothetical protein [Pyrinomonadaceae bacterium]